MRLIDNQHPAVDAAYLKKFDGRKDFGREFEYEFEGQPDDPHLDTNAFSNNFAALNPDDDEPGNLFHGTIKMQVKLPIPNASDLQPIARRRSPLPNTRPLKIKALPTLTPLLQ